MTHRDFAFDLRRFGALLRLQWRQQPRWPYLLSPLLTLLVCWLLLVRPDQLYGIGMHGFTNNINSACAICAMLSCSLYAGHVFWEWSRPDAARQLLCLPAGVFEKWFAKVLLAFVLFPIYAILVIWLCTTGTRLYVLHEYAFRFQPVSIITLLQTTISVLFIPLLAFTIGQLIKYMGSLLTLAGYIGLYLVAMVLAMFSPQMGGYGTETLNTALVAGHPVPETLLYLQKISQWLSFSVCPGLILGSFLAFRDKEV